MSDEILNTHDIPSKLLTDIEARAERVSNLLRKSATLWLEIAREVFDAKQTLSKDAFELFLEKASLSPAIADKMPKIAKSTILYSDEAKKYVDKLEGWSTLYELAKLSSDEKRQFFNALNNDPNIVVSREFIQSFKEAKRNDKKSVTIVAEVKISNDDIQRLDVDQFLEFKKMLADFTRRIDSMSPAISFELKEKTINDVERKMMNEGTDTDTDTDNKQLLKYIQEAA